MSDKIISSKNEKLQFTLVPLDCLEDVIRVIQQGAKKYGPNSWKTLPSKIFEDALFRHYSEHLKGKIIDPEWNLPHLAHLIANGLFLLWKMKRIMNIQDGIPLKVLQMKNEGELKSIEALKRKNGVDT